MKRTLLITIATLVTIQSSFAQGSSQTSPVQNALSSLFEHLDLSHVSTGYLKDKAVETVDLFRFDGLSLNSDNDSNCQVLYDSFLTINSSKANNIGTEYDVDTIVSALSDTSSVVLGASLFKYNFIVANAVSDSLVLFNNGQLYDNYRQGVWQNPYGESYAFIFAPSVPIHRGTTVHYKFSSNNIYGNCQVQQVQVDFDDGNGYVSLGSNYNQSISYLTTGTKDLKMRVSLVNGTILQSHSSFEVEDYPASPFESGFQPDKSEVISLYYNQSVSAIVSYKYADGHNGRIVRPLIYVEGYDDGLLGLFFSFSSLADLFHYYVNMIKEKSLGVCTFSWLYGELSSEANIINNYDIVYVDWINPRADIKDNAALLKQIIRRINQNKLNLSVNNIIIGHSMGGLITRYALRTMEIQGESHQTAYYVSYDSPHYGVNVPLGIQYAFWDFYDMCNGSGIESIFLDYAVNTYNSPSVKQMMYYYIPHMSSPTTSYHDSWQSELDEIGFPKGDPGNPIENLAISNGGNFTCSDTLFHAQKSLGIDLPSLSIVNNLSFSFSAFPNRGDGQVISRSSATLKKQFLWKPHTIIQLLGGVREHNSPYGTPAYDIISSSSLLDDLSLPSFISSFVSINPIAFVPTTSALAISDTVSIPPVPLIETPFHSYKYPYNSSHSHDTMPSGLWSWLYRQTEMRIIGPLSFVNTGDVFSVYRIGSDYTSSVWTTSDQSRASFNSDTLIVHQPGPVRITYYCADPTQIYYKHREVFAGIPAMYLAKSYTSGGTSRVSARCVDSSICDAFSEYVNAGVFSYVWGEKIGTGDIVWNAPTSNPYYDVNVPANSEVSVFMKLKTSRGGYGQANFILVQRGNYEFFCHEPQAIYVTPNFLLFDNLYDGDFMGPNGKPLIMPRRLCLWRNEDYPNTLSPDSISIGNESFLPFDTITATLYGTPVVLYPFGLLSSSVIQDAIDEIRDTYYDTFPYVGEMIHINIVCSDVVEQTIILPVVRPIL